MFALWDTNVESKIQEGLLVVTEYIMGLYKLVFWLGASLLWLELMCVRVRSPGVPQVNGNIRCRSPFSRKIRAPVRNIYRSDTWGRSAAWSLLYKRMAQTIFKPKHVLHMLSHYSDLILILDWVE